MGSSLLKSDIEAQLSSTIYNDEEIIDGIYLLHKSGFHQLRVYARMFAKVCTSSPPVKPASFTIQKTWNEHNPKISDSYSGFPLEIAMFMDEVTADEWTALFTAHRFQPNAKKPFKFVSRTDFQSVIKRFCFPQKWNDIKSKLKTQVQTTTNTVNADKSKKAKKKTVKTTTNKVDGLNKKWTDPNSVFRYVRNFMTIVDWMHRTRQLPVTGWDVLDDFAKGGTTCISYLEPQKEVTAVSSDDLKSEFDQALNNAEVYLGDKALRHLIRDDKTMTDLLNMGYAKAMASKRQRPNDNQKFILVVGLTDMTSKWSQARLSRLNNLVFNEKYEEVKGHPYDEANDNNNQEKDDSGISVSTFRLCSTVIGQLSDDVHKDNLCLSWNSNILFPYLLKRIPTAAQFHDIYIDHMVSTHVKTDRMKDFYLFFEDIVPQLRVGSLVDDEASLYVPFECRMMSHFYRSLPKLSKYVTVSFVNEANDCFWGKATKVNINDSNDYHDLLKTVTEREDGNEIYDCRTLNDSPRLIHELIDMKTQLKADIDKMEKSKRSPNVDPDSKKENYKQAVIILDKAIDEWKLVTNKTVMNIGWMKINFLNENSPKSDKTIKYPPQIQNTNGTATRTEMHGITVMCNLASKDELVTAVKKDPIPEISMVFRDGTTAVVNQICFDDSTSVEGSSFKVPSTEPARIPLSQGTPKKKRKRGGDESHTSTEEEEDPP